MEELTTISAVKLASLIENKRISCVEVMQAYLDQIAKVNPIINAIVQLLPAEEALKQARIADEAIARGHKLGKLQGIPVTIKDGRKVKDFLITLGNESPLNSIATTDATLVERLRNAGAIIIGITNIPDFSMSYDTANKLYGVTHNPYDLQRSPGGSSGGEAAAIAAGCSALGIGADSGGSIRQPAHNCGIVGLKPTRGLLPSTGQFPEDGLGIFSYVSVQGPFARYVEDIAEVLPILIGPDDQDPNVFPIVLRDPAAVDLKSLRIAFYTGNGVATPRMDVCETVENAAQALTKYVASVKEDYPKISKETYSDFEELFFYGGDKGEELINRMERMQVREVAPPFQAILDRAVHCEFSVTELRNRLVKLEQFKIMMMNFIRNYDVIICPVATGPANLYEKSLTAAEGFDLAYDLTYNLPYNIAGWPAIVVRCGTSKEGLPIGVQIIAKSWREDIVLSVAKKLEETFGGWKSSAILTNVGIV